MDLERAGRLVSILTQNIDGLHQRAGSVSVLELHGTMHETVCLTCGDRRPMRAALDRVAAGAPDPECLVCGGILKSATISFGQPLDVDVLSAARDAALACDLMLAVGSSLSVQPAAGLVGLAARAGAAVVICNASETPYDGLAAIVLRGPLGEVLPALVSGTLSPAVRSASSTRSRSTSRSMPSGRRGPADAARRPRRRPGRAARRRPRGRRGGGRAGVPGGHSAMVVVHAAQVGGEPLDGRRRWAPGRGVCAVARRRRRRTSVRGRGPRTGSSGAITTTTTQEQVADGHHNWEF